MQRANAHAQQMMQAAESRQADSDLRYAALIAELHGARAKPWDDAEKFRGCRDFSGKASEWEEWSAKFLGTIKSKSIVLHTILRSVEHHLSERDLEADDYATSISMLDAEMPGEKEVEVLSSKLHRLLGDLTTQEANATIRRCRGENGMLAWKRLAAIHNTKTLASGLKALTAVQSTEDQRYQKG